MQIRSEQHGNLLELHLEGRLDAEWSPTLWEAIDSALRQGRHSLIVDLSGVGYASSAGLAVLVRAHQQFKAIRGFFGAGDAQPQVEEIIRLSGLAKMLLCDLAAARRSRGSVQSTLQFPAGLVAGQGAAFEVYDLDPGAPMTCSVIGDPARLESGTYQSSTRVTFEENTGGLGLGAFGTDFAECSDRFGELLAVTGTVAQLPAGGAGTPDFQAGRGEFVPSAQLLYGLKWRGAYTRLLRFDATDSEHPLGLTSLVEQSLELSGTSAAVLTIAAETTGLVGAALRRSPAQIPEGGVSRFHHPEVRDWVFFTPERAWPRSLALITGVAARLPLDPSVAALDPLLRPMSRSGTIAGHFHAAVFPFRAFKKRRLELEDLVRTLFDDGQLQGLMHLLNDEREISGAGDTECLRGACWVGPIVAAGRDAT